MPDPSVARPAPARRGGWIPWAFVGGFGVVVAANAALVAFALSSWTGITAEGVFRQQAGFNATLAQARAQAGLGWTLAVRYEETGAREGRLLVEAADAGGRALAGATVAAAFRRPTADGLDFPAALAPRGSGAYAADIAFPLPGQWDVELTVTRGADTYRTLRRLHVPG